MERMRYRDFELHIERDGEQYKAHVLDSPEGTATNFFSIPFSPETLEGLIFNLGHVRRGTRGGRSSQIEAARELGGKLFETVFGRELAKCYRASLNAVRRQEGYGLRIKLRLQNVAELADLPWEFLLDTSLNHFIAQSIQTPVVRYIEIPEAIQPLAMPPPLRVLVLISSPDDRDYPPLDVKRERASLHQALDPLIVAKKVTLEFLEKPTLSKLQRRLRQEKYHVIHFIGHGEFVKSGDQGEGVLVLEDKQGRASLAKASLLGPFLHDHTSVRLVVLNSCEGARNSKTDLFAGVATTLIQQGVPAAVAMQFEITDEAAIAFAEEFYTALAEGFPVDAAVAEARKAILAQHNDIEWGTPVLYMRSADGVLFRLSEPPIPPEPPPPDPNERIHEDKPPNTSVEPPPPLPPRRDQLAIRLPSVRTMGGHTATVNCVAFSPDGQHLASGAGDEYWSDDNTIRLWRISDGELVKTLKGHTQRVVDLAFSPGGKLLASASGGGFWGSDNTARLWQIPKGRLARTLSGHSNYVLRVAFSPDGSTLATASVDNSARLWRVSDGKLIKTLDHQATVRDLAFSPDGRRLATASDRSVRQWKLPKATQVINLEGHTGEVSRLAFSPDGTILASAGSDNTVRFWRVNGDPIRTLGGHRNPVTSLAFSPDGAVLATASRGKVVRLWRVNSGDSLGTLQPHKAAVAAVVFSPDGDILATGSVDGLVQLWRASDATLLHRLEGHTAGITTLSFSPDGQVLASASFDKTVRLWAVNRTN